MSKALVKLAFRQEIGALHSGAFEKEVFNDSFIEFCMQAQLYNPGDQLRTLEELIINNPKASSLHNKVGFSVGLYIKGLNGNIPGIRDLVPGHTRPSFQSHNFEIISSDLTNRLMHRVAITYYTGVLTLLDSFGDNLLLATGDMAHVATGEWIDTFMLKTSSTVTITQYAPLKTGMVYHRPLAN